jgi:isochorismate synthase EntC
MADKKLAENFYCKYCDYNCNKKSDYIKHLTTGKHKRLTKKSPLDMIYKCHCGKTYSHRQSLHKHKKNCKSLEDKLDILIETNKILLKENKEIKDKLNDHNQPTQINNNFNLHFYLNETCKDALNLNDFLSNINIEAIDLDEILNSGIESNMKNIFIKNLKKIEQEKRPIQCTDIKRDIVYVKDENVWQKDNEHEKLRYSIKEVQNKHVKSLNKLTDNINNDNYVEIVSKISDDIKTDSIKKTILKETKINKY